MEESALLADFYEFTMLQAWHDRGENPLASFEVFVRTLPPRRNFLLAAGLGTALDWLEQLGITDEELAWLAGTGRFRPGFIRSLASLRFTGDVWAMPEGTVFFPDEPVLRVTAPMREAQLVESRVLNIVHYQTIVASKAVRCVTAAQGRQLVDFGLRRAHGGEAGLLSARASYIAGFDATATTLAGARFGIPVSGTMAHSFVQAHADETDAFEHFARAQPSHASLLLDTWDTAAAARKVVALGQRLAREGVAIPGVRLDSGDLGALAREVRFILDVGGLKYTTIFASGNLDEDRIAALVAGGAPIDGFGVGTRMNTSADAPYLDCAYKLVSVDGRPTCKASTGKATWPGEKQVWRRVDAQGAARGDTVGLASGRAEGVPLLQAAMRAGRRCAAPETLERMRERVRTELARLGAPWTGLSPAERYPVAISPELAQLAAALRGGAEKRAA